MKIIGVGNQKTGTTTLGAALRLLGYRHQSYSVRSSLMYANGSLEELLTWSDHYQSFDDVPWALLYRELDDRHPGSKFILTYRRSSQAWFDSLAKHMQRMGSKSASHEMNEAIYGRPDPQHDRALAIRVYEEHNEAVRRYFRDRPGDFIELCWENGDGWPELTGFLGRPIPAASFPHANRAPNWREKLRSQWQRLRRSRRARALIDGRGEPEQPS